MSVKLMYNIMEENFMIVVDFMGAQHINTIILTWLDHSFEGKHTYAFTFIQQLKSQ